MELKKETIDKAKIRTEERISDWIESCQNAGITRLYDQYGPTSFKRIEYKRNGKDDKLLACKTAVPARLRPLKRLNEEKGKKKKCEAGINDTDGKRKTPVNVDARPLKSRQSGEKIRGRQTPRSDSTRKNRDSASIFREMNNKSSHNRSSYKSSICSMDAISLMCDDPKDYHSNHGGYYLSSNLDSRFKSYDFGVMKSGEVFKGQKEWEKSGKDGIKSKYSKRTKPKPYLDTIARAEKNFYNCEQFENYKPIMKKITERKDNFKQVRAQKHCDLIEEDAEYPTHRSEKNDRENDFNACSSANLSKHTSTTVSHIPVTFTIDTGSNHGSPRGSALSHLRNKSKSSIGFVQTSPTHLVNESNSFDNVASNPGTFLSTTPSSVGFRVASSLALRRGKSRATGIALSATPSTMLKGGKSAMLVRTISRRFPGTTSSSSNIAAEIKKEAVLDRFRKFTNKFIAVSRLLNGVKMKMKQQNREEISSVKKEQEATHKSNVLDFDASYFKTATTSYGGLTHRARDALWKMANQRTEQDIRTLNEVMDRLTFFNKYPKSLKAELAKMLWYDRFENGRVIIRQGDIGSRMYFVVSGCVSLQTTGKDPRTGCKQVMHLKDVKSGSTFGELALIRDVKRNYTAVCKGDAEFLSLSKDEFNNVLRHKWIQDWQERNIFIANLSSFEGATATKVNNATDMSELKEFSDRTVIYGDKAEMSENVYFIKKGKCEMIKKVELVRSQSPYLRPSLFLSDTKKNCSNFLDKSYGKKQRICRKETHVLTVMPLYPGDFFGVGENLKDTYIIAKGKVECLIINSAFYAINLMMDRLDNMKHQIEKKIPSNHKLYRKFEENRKWTEYKRNVVESVVRKKGFPNVTSMEDIPKILTMEPSIPEDLIWKENL